MDTILLSSGFLDATLAELARRWQVIDIPSPYSALDHLRTSSQLPAVVVIGHVVMSQQSSRLEWDEAVPDEVLLTASRMLQHVLEIDPDLPVIISTHEQRASAIVELVKRGAFDYVVEPPRDPQADQIEQYTQHLVFALGRAVQWRKTLLENRLLKQQLKDDGLVPPRTAAMIRVLAMVDKVAPTMATVVITGESGTGKEVIARTIHGRSQRSREPFLAVNCGTLSESLLASELFGHEKGALTGADTARAGLIRQAERGTLFLDEISSISPAFQVMLLRAIEERVGRPVGGTAEYPVHCRFIAAANRDLEEMVRHGQFRQDLFYRLNVFGLHLPPLRKRVEDIPALAQFFLSRAVEEFAREISGFDPAAMALLERHVWPGNVRELRNVVERAVILCEGRRITPPDIMGHLSQADNMGLTGAVAQDYDTFMRQQETRLLRAVLGRTEGNVAQASRLLKMKRSTLNYRIRQLGLRKG